MSENNINEFLLDQELESEPTGYDLPDDIDSILDAVESEDEVFSFNTTEDQKSGSGKIATKPAKSFPNDGIPLMTDIIDPPPKRRRR